MGGLLKTKRMNFLSAALLTALIIVAIFFLAPNFVRALSVCDCHTDSQCDPERGLLCDVDAYALNFCSPKDDEGLCRKACSRPNPTNSIGTCKSKCSADEITYDMNCPAGEVCCYAGGTGPTCDNDAECDSGETIENCPFDCAPCTDAINRKDAKTCQGGETATHTDVSQCRWCGDAGSGYEYDIPKLTTPTVQESWPFCVNITNDPFNCGECGFIGGIEATPDDVTGGVCAGDQPYCAGRECHEPGASDIAEQVLAYIGSHSPLNPSYYPYSPGGGVYASDQIDTNPAACAFGGGTLSEFGCCGDGKCRVTEGKICHATSICDGTKWHDASLTSQNGEVFLTPMCKSIYPVANINGEFIKCVDEDRFQDYLKSMAKAAGACIPDEYFNAFTYEFPQWHTEGNPIPWDWVEQYICPAGTYLTEIATSTGSSGVDQCRIKPANLKVSSSGVLICTAESSGNNAGLFGFATMGNADYTNIAGWFTNPAGGEHNIPLCPAPISVWDGVTTIGINPLACPGKVNVNNVPAGTWLMVYGSNAGKRSAIFCSDNPALKPDATLDFMGYVRGNGTIMGNVSGHDYVCTTNFQRAKVEGQSRAFIGVCCGSRGCGDIPGSIGAGGATYPVGGMINISGKYLYCMADGRWGVDLDYNVTQDACKQAGFLATGKYCCSEWDDTATCVQESYNELGSKSGACFKGEEQYNNFNLIYNSQLYSNVFLINGTFYGCGFNNSLFTPEFEKDKIGTDCSKISLCKPGTDGSLSKDCLQSVENWPNPGTGGSTTRTKQPLIKAVDYCTIFSFGSNSTQSVYCAFDNNWTNAGRNNFSHKSIVPDPLFSFFNKTIAGSGGDVSKLMRANCCLPNYCWDPSKGVCIPEQLGYSDYYQVNLTTVYKCLQGVWVNILGEGKRTPDGCVVGFCPESNQCLFNIAGNPNQNNNVSEGANPQCIANGQYKGDFVCNNGSWTTRTKVLALKMASLVEVGKDFVLMCAPSDAALVNAQNPGSANNYCVLNLGGVGGQRILGTTLNQAFVSSTHNDFISALEQSFLLSYPGSGVQFNSLCTSTPTTFIKCVDNQYLKVYYEPTYQMVFFSSESISGLMPGIGATICDALPSWLKWLCSQPGVLERNLAGLRLFNKVYASRLGSAPVSKEVFGLAEQICDPVSQVKKWVYTFNYTGLSNADLSYLVSHVDAENASITLTGNNVFIKNPVRDAWVALTILRNTEQE
jgi:hypothetical protein